MEITLLIGMIYIYIYMYIHVYIYMCVCMAQLIMCDNYLATSFNTSIHTMCKLGMYLQQKSIYFADVTIFKAFYINESYVIASNVQQSAARGQYNILFVDIYLIYFNLNTFKPQSGPGRGMSLSARMI